MTSHSPASSPELPHRLPRLHRLKTDPEVYQAVLSGHKTFEIRLNDRDFRVGDELLLMETTVTGEAIRAGAPLQFTGNELRKRVSHVLSGYGLMPDWVCLSFEAGSAAAAQAAKQVPAGWKIERSGQAVSVIEVTAPDGNRWCVVAPQDEDDRERKIGAFFYELCSDMLAAPTGEQA